MKSSSPRPRAEVKQRPARTAAAAGSGEASGAKTPSPKPTPTPKRTTGATTKASAASAASSRGVDKSVKRKLAAAAADADAGAAAGATAAAPGYAIAQEISRLLVELGMTRSNRYMAIIAEFEMSPIQARTLFLLDPGRSMTMSEAAQKTASEPSNLTGVIDKLEARGLAKRSLDATDRRVKLVTLTRGGAALRARLVERLYAPAPWMLALSTAEKDQLVALLRKGMDLAKTLHE